jgi:TonB family protein
MDRLQKKCVIVSASMHGLLAATLLFGSAFLAPSGNKSPDLDVLTVIPDLMVDTPISNPGGNPNVKQPPPLAAPVIVPPPPPAPQPRQETAVKPPQPVPDKPAPEKISDEPDPTRPATGKHVPTVNPKLVTRKADPRAKTSADDNSEAEARAEAKAAADARNRARLALQGAATGIGSVASSSTSVDIPGPGGQAYANYAQVVKSVYTQAWTVPADVDDDQATTKARVTIARDGRVLSAKIIGPSGNAAVDASVQRTLERVQTIGREFPAGAKEDQRTFTISFNLKAKRQLG